MKVLGVGLSKTGTTSLAAALELLGYRCLHFDHERLDGVLAGREQHPDFRVYDDVDAVTDVPAAFFYRELLQAYPEAKAILTVRDAESWWRSMRVHAEVRSPTSHVVSRLVREAVRRPAGVPAVWRMEARRRQIRNAVYGSEVAHRVLYMKRFREHNERVLSEVPAERLLVMDIVGGEGWEKLCPFLGADIPDQPFPKRNQSNLRPVARA